MDQSYITHQRRPALIPAGVQLAPEDEQAVRLRTGYVNPTSKRDSIFFHPCFTEHRSYLASAKVPQAATSGKRKASALEEDEEADEDHQARQGQPS